MVARVPMMRLAATKEIGDVPRYLAGDEASYITGQTIIAYGGWTVQGIPHAPSWVAIASRRLSLGTAGSKLSRPLIACRRPRGTSLAGFSPSKPLHR